jgi:hypothetical protein
MKGFAAGCGLVAAGYLIDFIALQLAGGHHGHGTSIIVNRSDPAWFALAVVGAWLAIVAGVILAVASPLWAVVTVVRARARRAS